MSLLWDLKTHKMMNINIFNSIINQTTNTIYTIENMNRIRKT